MVIVQLKGGLGNQLFQYAAGLSLAMHHNVQLKVDITELDIADKEIGTIRHFDLQQLILAPTVATDDEIKKMTHQNLVIKYFQKLLPPYQRKIYKEKDFSFDEHFFSAGNNIYLKGYRQSEQYFASIADIIKNGFVFKSELTNSIEPFAKKFRETNSVSIHIRRGDYSNTELIKIHGILENSYYQNCIDTMQQKLGKCHFYIFSDTPDWVKQNLQFNEDSTFVSGNITSNHFQDFYLISQCQHNIIANSTFSWWAAWLNNNKEKIVIAPQRWFNNTPYNTKDLFAKGWLKV